MKQVRSRRSPAIIFFGLLVVCGIGGSGIQAQSLDVTLRIAAGSADARVEWGTIWLYQIVWGDLRKIRLSDIQGGNARIQLTPERLAREIQPRPDVEYYVGVIEIPPGTWYRTPDIPPDQVFQKLIPGLESLGQTRMTESGTRTVVLPPYSEQCLVLLFPDGRPLAGEEIPVSIFMTTRNHCRVHYGFPLGRFTTDSEGAIRVRAPDVMLYLDLDYYRPEGQSPAGPLYCGEHGVKIQAGPRQETRAMWQLPLDDYEIRVQQADGAPGSGLSLLVCDRENLCGIHCGKAGVTNLNGNLKFRSRLPAVEALWLVSADESKKFKLDDGEFNELLVKKTVTVVWRPSPVQGP